MSKNIQKIPTDPQEYIQKGKYTEIIIRNFKASLVKAKVKIDNEDVETSKERKWCVEKKGYVVSAGRKGTIRLHSFLMGKKLGFEIDHINRNKLDNRRKNLRVVSHHENTLNRTQTGDGVSFRKDKKKWRARVKWRGKEKSIGHFLTEAEAIQARKKFIKSGRMKELL